MSRSVRGFALPAVALLALALGAGAPAVAVVPSDVSSDPSAYATPADPTAPDPAASIIDRKSVV